MESGLETRGWVDSVRVNRVALIGRVATLIDETGLEGSLITLGGDGESQVTMRVVYPDDASSTAGGWYVGSRDG